MKMLLQTTIIYDTPTACRCQEYCKENVKGF